MKKYHFTIIFLAMILIVAVLSYADEVFLRYTNPPWLWDENETVVFNESHLDWYLDSLGFTALWFNDTGDTKNIGEQDVYIENATLWIVDEFGTQTLISGGDATFGYDGYFGGDINAGGTLAGSFITAGGGRVDGNLTVLTDLTLTTGCGDINVTCGNVFASGHNLTGKQNDIKGTCDEVGAIHTIHDNGSIECDLDANYFVSSAKFNGTSNKTLNLTRQGLESLTANFTDFHIINISVDSIGNDRILNFTLSNGEKQRITIEVGAGGGAGLPIWINHTDGHIYSNSSYNENVTVNGSLRSARLGINAEAGYPFEGNFENNPLSYGVYLLSNTSKATSGLFRFDYAVDPAMTQTGNAIIPVLWAYLDTYDDRTGATYLQAQRFIIGENSVSQTAGGQLYLTGGFFDIKAPEMDAGRVDLLGYDITLTGKLDFAGDGYNQNIKGIKITDATTELNVGGGNWTRYGLELGGFTNSTAFNESFALRIRDHDDGGWSCCYTLDGEIACEVC